VYITKILYYQKTVKHNPSRVPKDPFEFSSIVLLIGKTKSTNCAEVVLYNVG